MYAFRLGSRSLDLHALWLVPMARVERSSKEFRKPKRCASGGHPRTVQGTTGVQSSFKVVHPLRASGADPAD